MRIVDGRKRTEHILDGAIALAKLPDGVLTADAAGRAKMADGFITKVKAADEVIIRDTITIKQDGSAQTGAKGYMPFAGDIVACSFMNDSGAAFTAAAKISVTAGDVVSSTATLADGTSERIATGLANNTGLAKGAEITLTTGTTVETGATIAIIEVEAKLNAVA